jgi:hypothetical protein
MIHGRIPTAGVRHKGRSKSPDKKFKNTSC